jgi:uncharacterized protein YggU (UPF0235/DUF167 family)
MSQEVTPELIEAVKAKAVDGRATCPVMRKLAEDLGVPYKLIGEAADAAGVKIKNCELGCF